MKKRFASLLLCLALCLGALPLSAGAAFSDISDQETAVAAAALQGLGVVSGTSADTFSPNGTLTRAQVCTMAVNAAGLSSQVSTYARKTLFSDVSPSAWYNGYVNLAYSQGLVNGNGDGTFSPDAPITYGAMATILLRMLGYTSEEIGSVWPLDYTAFCDQLGLSQGLNLGAYDVLTRGQAAVLFYRAIKATANGTGQPYYTGINGVASTSDAILLDTNASYGGSSGLLMVYDLNEGGVTYYTQAQTQSDALEGYLGVLLFDSSGRVAGFVPESESVKDLTIGSASASTLTDSSGVSYRIASGAVVLSGGSSYPYSTSGYLQLNAQKGKSVRLFYDDNGAVTYLYLSGSTTAASQAAVASSTSAESSLALALGISEKQYAITKNGVSADSSDLTQYDVGYYDAATNTLRTSDYRVCGYLSYVSPSLAAAETITVAGCTFDVLESAWDTLADFQLGDKVTLLLTDDGKVAAAYAATSLSADMVGVLAQDGKSVTLSGSGITLTADTMTYSDTAPGSLVTVSASSASTLRCSAVSTVSAAVDLTAETVGELELAPSCAVYEWAGSGYVYDLDGNQGASSSDFTAIDWTDSLSQSDVSYYHTNSAGQVDVLLLNDVTGNCYEYGEVTRYTGQSGINLGGTIGAYNAAAVLTNGQGSSEKYLCTLSVSGKYMGLALGGGSNGYRKVTKAASLNSLSDVDSGDFFLQGESWYVQGGDDLYEISSQVQIHLSGADLWLSGEEGLATVLADGYDLTLYYDRAPDEGGRIRLIVAE